eukprot:3119925-Amphidinium_carterae.2
MLTNASINSRSHEKVHKSLRDLQSGVTWRPAACRGLGHICKPRARSGNKLAASRVNTIIDFGNATYEDEHHSSVINTRQYRGPEVVLELGWDVRSDIWSLGCL